MDLNENTPTFDSILPIIKKDNQLATPQRPVQLYALYRPPYLQMIGIALDFLADSGMLYRHYSLLAQSDPIALVDIKAVANEFHNANANS